MNLNKLHKAKLKKLHKFLVDNNMSLLAERAVVSFNSKTNQYTYPLYLDLGQEAFLLPEIREYNPAPKYSNIWVLKVDKLVKRGRFDI
jgi:hypothetical protein